MAILEHFSFPQINGALMLWPKSILKRYLKNCHKNLNNFPHFKIATRISTKCLMNRLLSYPNMYLKYCVLSSVRILWRVLKILCAILKYFEQFINKCFISAKPNWWLYKIDKIEMTAMESFHRRKQEDVWQILRDSKLVSLVSQ